MVNAVDRSVHAPLDATDAALVDAIARQVLALLDERDNRLVDAAEVARHLGVSRDVVYANAQRLGGVRLGDGPRPRWRFNVVTATRNWATVREHSDRSQTADPASQAGSRRRRRRSNGNNPGLLPIRGGVTSDVADVA